MHRCKAFSSGKKCPGYFGYSLPYLLTRDSITQWHVRVRRIGRIRIKPEWLEREAAEDPAALRFIVSLPGISRELRVYIPRGTFRFFRVPGNSLVEVDGFGIPLPGQQAVPVRSMANGAPAWTEKTVDPESAPGSPGPAVKVPLFLLPAATSGSVDSLTGSDVRQGIRMLKVFRPGTEEEPKRFFNLREENAASRQMCGRRRTLSFSRVLRILRWREYLP